MSPHLVLGGTFDPLHRGHLAAAEAVARAFGEPVTLLPAGRPPHRPPPHAPAAARLALIEAACRERPWLRVDRRELDRPGPSWTVDSLAEMRAELGAARPLVFVLGEDAFGGFGRWREPGRILELAHLLVLTRPGAGRGSPAGLTIPEAGRPAEGPEALCAAPAGRILPFAIPPLPISSSLVRERLRRGEPVGDLLTPEVETAIRERGLYRAPLAS